MDLSGEKIRKEVISRNKALFCTKIYTGTIQNYVTKLHERRIRTNQKLKVLINIWPKTLYFPNNICI